MSPINHATTTAIIGGTQWNEDHVASGTDLQYLTVPLTDAQIKALPTTAVTLIPAQGAGTVIVTGAVSESPSGLALVHHHVTDYIGVDPNAEFRFRLGTNGGYMELGLLVDDMLVWGAADDVIWLPDAFDVTAGAPKFNGATDMTNKPVQIIGTNGGPAGTGPDFTGGDAANTLTVHCWYRVISI